MKFFKISLVITSLLGLGFLATSPVFAALPQAPNSSAGTSASYNWAGYVATGNNFTAITGTWTIPTVSDPGAGMADASWVGIGGVTSADLIQAGTLNNNGQTQAWYETLPQTIQPIALAVSPGNSITVLISEQSANLWSIYFRNNSTGGTYQTSVSYNSSLSSAEWIEEMPASNFGYVPLDNFGSVNFTGSSAVENGQSLTLAQIGAQPMTMLNHAGQILAAPSGINGDGGSFTITRTSATVTSAGTNPGFGRRGSHRVGVGVQGYTPPARTGSFGHRFRGFQFLNFSSFHQSFSRISFR